MTKNLWCSFCLKVHDQSSYICNDCVDQLREQCDVLKKALRISLQAESNMRENLTNVQARCTELLLENRRLRGI